MKKFIVLALSIVLFSAAKAQISYQLPPLAGDVVINNAVFNKTLQITTGTSGLVWQFNIVVNTGTGAGTAQLQISNDGVNFINSGSAYTILNATQSSSFSIPAPVPGWVRIVFSGGTTMNITIKDWVRLPRYQPTP